MLQFNLGSHRAIKIFIFILFLISNPLSVYSFPPPQFEFFFYLAQLKINNHHCYEFSCFFSRTTIQLVATPASTEQQLPRPGPDGLFWSVTGTSPPPHQRSSTIAAICLTFGSRVCVCRGWKGQFHLQQWLSPGMTSLLVVIFMLSSNNL